MKILVTGGAGYIGSHVIRCLAGAGHDVWAYDNLSVGHAAAVPAGRLIVGDLLDQQHLQLALLSHKIEAVIHLAGSALVGESIALPAKYYQNNVVGSLSLLDAMQACGVSRLVFSSTTATYGTPEQLPIRETQLQHPINPYGFTKMVVEQALEDYARAHGLDYMALRFFNAAGASLNGDLGEDHDPETHLIPLVLKVALGQLPHISIFGDDYPTPDGTCVRDYVHVEDLASAHLSAVERLRPGIRWRLNVGIGQGFSIWEIIEACRQITGHRIPAQVGTRRAGDPPALVADASLATQLLQWKPQMINIYDIIETAWRWHRAHPYGYERRAKLAA